MRALQRLGGRAARGTRGRGAVARRLTATLPAAALLLIALPTAPTAFAWAAGAEPMEPTPSSATPTRGVSAAPARIPESAESLVARGNEAWERRAEGRRDGRADAGPIGEAVQAYEKALATAPGSIAIRARLLRALYFQGRFATTEGGPRRAVYARGRDLAEEGIDRLAADLGSPLDPHHPTRTAAAAAERKDAVSLFFWAAAHWGLLGESVGVFTAARQGVVGKVRDHAEVVIRIDDRYEAAGGLRIRGRLHTEAPRIPLVTGWVDRDVAVSSLERAVQLAPGEPLNRLYLAESLLRYRPRRRDEAIALLERLLAEPPRPGWLMEDEAALEDVRMTLTRLAD